jgi:hypothetical protein
MLAVTLRYQPGSNEVTFRRPLFPFTQKSNKNPITGRKAGGQAGHEGHTLQFNPELEVIEPHRRDQSSPVSLRKL